MSISEILGVGIPDKNSIHHKTRHGRDNLLLALRDRFCMQDKTDFAGYWAYIGFILFP